jgi:alanine racemase
MQLTSKIISIRLIKEGESIGYGSIFTAQRDTIVGVVACGYADGYPRAASSEYKVASPVAVDGVMTRLIGRVSMDMLFVNLSDIPNAKIGSAVELWGDTVLANDVAKAAGTIAYELFCNVKRVQFQYSDS